MRSKLLVFGGSIVVAALASYAFAVSRQAPPPPPGQRENVVTMEITDEKPKPEPKNAVKGRVKGTIQNDPMTPPNPNGQLPPTDGSRVDGK